MENQMVGFHICFEVAAVILCIICYFFARRTSRIRLRRNRIYSLILISIIISGSCNIWNNVIEEFSVKAMYSLQMPLQLIYLSLHVLLPMLYLLYIMEVNGTSRGGGVRQLFILIIAPIAFLELCIVSTPFTRFAFYYENNEYHRGSLYILFFTVGAVYILAAMLIFVLYRRALPLSTAKCLHVLNLVMLLGMLLQMVVRKMNTELLGEAIMATGLLLTLELGGTDMDPITGLRSRTGIIEEMNRRGMTHKMYDMIMVSVSNMDSYQKLVTTKEWNDFLFEFGTWLERVPRCEAAMQYTPGSFLLFFDHEKDVERSIVLSSIKDGMRKDWYAGSMEIHLHAFITYIMAPDDLATVEELDFLMNSLRDRNVRDIEVHMASELTTVWENRKLEEEIGLALKEDRILVYFQPVVDIQKNRILSAKTVVKMLDQGGRMIEASQFIPVSEKTGQIVQIGERVLEKVCRFLQKHPLSDTGFSCVEIYLSEKQLSYKNLVTGFERITREYEISPKDIRFEIGSMKEENIGLLKETMRRLREFGFDFEMNGFGIGYSNLNTLMDMNYRCIRFDKAILEKTKKDVKQRRFYENLARTIVDMGYDVIQEGISDEEEVVMARELGICGAEGSYYLGPVSTVEFIDYIERF